MPVDFVVTEYELPMRQASNCFCGFEQSDPTLLKSCTRVSPSTNVCVSYRDVTDTPRARRASSEYTQRALSGD